MIKTYLFEIQCAEDIGNFRLADKLSSNLVKIASTDHKSIKKKLQKDFSNINAIKEISFAPSSQKFIVYADGSLSNTVKKNIKQVAKPFVVSFKYS